MSLSEKIHDAYIRFVGNRITLGTEILMGSSVLASAYLFTDGIESADFANSILLAASFSLGLTFFGVTYGGATTLKSYKSAKKHIEIHKTIDDRFIAVWLRDKTSSGFSHCSMQGIYLAAKENNIENEFRVQLNELYASKNFDVGDLKHF